MEKNNQLDFLLSQAKNKGAQKADAICYHAEGLSMACRVGKLETLERTEGCDFGLRVFDGQKQAIASTSDPSEEGLRKLVDRVMGMLSVVPEDPFCGLPDLAEFAKEIPTLDIYDSQIPSEDDLLERAKKAEEAALSVKGISNSEGAESSWGRAQIYLANSEGFAGSYESSYHGVSACVVAGEGTGMERDYDYASSVYEKDLKTAEEIGLSAAQKTLRRLNPESMKTTKTNIVFDPRVSNSLLGHLASAINGASVAKGVTFLKDKMNKIIFPQNITIIDDPHKQKALSSKPFDGEGVANKKRVIIENGELQTWLLDSRSARQLNLKTTGHASRGTSSLPSPSTTNFYCEKGVLSQEELIRQIGQGVYITELIGFGVNGVTGDYSRGATGFLIENGEITKPVSGLTIAGNLLDMYSRMQIANDLEFKYSTNAPTIAVENMTVAGSQ